MALSCKKYIVNLIIQENNNCKEINNNENEKNIEIFNNADDEPSCIVNDEVLLTTKIINNSSTGQKTQSINNSDEHDKFLVDSIAANEEYFCNQSIKNNDIIIEKDERNQINLDLSNINKEKVYNYTNDTNEILFEKVGYVSYSSFNEKLSCLNKNENENTSKDCTTIISTTISNQINCQNTNEQSSLKSIKRKKKNIQSTLDTFIQNKKARINTVPSSSSTSSTTTNNNNDKTTTKVLPNNERKPCSSGNNKNEISSNCNDSSSKFEAYSIFDPNLMSETRDGWFHGRLLCLISDKYKMKSPKENQPFLKWEEHEMIRFAYNYNYLHTFSRNFWKSLCQETNSKLPHRNVYSLKCHWKNIILKHSYVNKLKFPEEIKKSLHNLINEKTKTFPSTYKSNNNMKKNN